MNELAARIDRLESRAAIRQLLYRYAHAFARSDYASLVELFAEDVRVGRDASGRAALLQQMQDAMYVDQPARSVRITILHVGTHVIDFDGPDEAHGEVYSHGEMQRGDGTWFHQAIHYGDTYARRDGRWYFVRRRHQLFYGIELGQRPNGLPPANWPEHDTGTGTLPERWPTWQAYWSA
ncbi:MAG TPA: nuclear transport factor 2 family protein [Acidimicrobiales bacterium]|nr:nuclear transport factor 2 family protein [Acidimicrobiales bacterium]